ncbi:TetR/AcrR family transcriptional regulator [Pararhodobacter zhoushanensis]|uniref:TetR/AcrR family transcriptional regulator n=1 Tax=Pararhodobacter zhoushanensis TaxID=2479545 RepID=A0ABT3H138_9RHOB|nr:TetR/AcrR family transcriptional regulator [Pararhodobacter zhoushanensis]MCW1933536.1 TetR/AcrR family transcriptional regulator [Pararhodobacter zhoushanensis]
MAARTRAAMMEETRTKLMESARKAFAEKGFSATSMDDLTAAAGLTRGALYHNFGDKRGLLAAVVDQIDAEMAAHARRQADSSATLWDGLLAEGAAYIEMALDPEVQRIVLLDGPAFLGDPSQWPSQNRCLEATREAVTQLLADGIIRPVDIEAASRLLNGAALNAALWVAASENPSQTLPKAKLAFCVLAEGLLVARR